MAKTMSRSHIVDASVLERSEQDSALGKIKIYVLLCSTSTAMRRLPGTKCADYAAALGTLVLCRIKTYVIVGSTLRSIPLRCVRHVTTLVTFCNFYAMSERHSCLVHNVWPEAGVSSCTVSLCGLSSVSVCFLPFDRWFVMFGAVNADALHPCVNARLPYAASAVRFTNAALCHQNVR